MPVDRSISRGVVLVTGGGGFIGRAVVERLIRRGWSVRSLSRNRYPDLERLGVQVVRGDLADLDAVATAARDCRIVFHVAAQAGVWGPYRDYHRTNVVGTRNVITACRRHGVSRLVLTSSPSVVFDGTDQSGVDESIAYPVRHHSHYSATKAIAERMVLQANTDGLRTIALRPHLVWGPRDNHIVPRLLDRRRRGQLRRIGRGDPLVDTTYIDNAADAHILAADALVNNPRSAGRAYFITQGQPVGIWTIINRILHAGGLPPVTRSIPRPVAMAAATIFETVHGALRIAAEPRLTRFVVRELTSAHWFDITAAERELGYQPTVSIEEGLRRLHRWLCPPREAARDADHADASGPPDPAVSRRT